MGQKVPDKPPAYNLLYQKDDWVDVESRQDITRLRERLQHTPHSLKLHEIALFYQVMTLAVQYKDFFAKNPHWPSACMQELQVWLKLFPIRFCGFIFIKSFKNQLNLANLITSFIKFHTVSATNQSSLKIDSPMRNFACTETSQLCYRNFQKILFDNGQIPDFTQYEKLLASHKEKPYIRVCLFCSNPGKEEQLESEETGVIARVKILGQMLGREALQFAMPYGHANFLYFDGQHYTKHGLYTTGIYHKEISARFSRYCDV